MKALLLNHGASIRKRLRFFDSTVGSCVLWCASSWTPRVEELRLLQTAKRAMLRRIVGQKRAPDKDFLSWVQRVTHKAESAAASAGVRDWIREHGRMKWQWAGHVARRPADSWLWRVTPWRDAEWQALANQGGASRPLRPSTRRWVKWEDSLRRYCSEKSLGSWLTLSSSRDTWAGYAEAFAEWSMIC
jgi:hypothetical protein